LPFICPHCAQSGTLQIRCTLELPADSRWDEIVLQVVACTGCGLAALAVYSESRRGALESECCDHTGYYVNYCDLLRIAELIQGCPHPGDPHCSCPSHRLFGGRDANGEWNGLECLHLEGQFALEWHP